MNGVVLAILVAVGLSPVEININNYDYSTPVMESTYESYEVVDIDSTTSDDDYIKIRLNDNADTNNSKYIVMIYSPEIGTVTNQFTLESTDFNTLPLPAEKNSLLIFKMSLSEYTNSQKSQTAKTKVTGLDEIFSFCGKADFVEKILVTAENTYNGINSAPAGYDGQSVHYSWSYSSKAVRIAAELKDSCNSDEEFAKAVVTWVHENIKYDTEKASNKFENPYDNFNADAVIEEGTGVCSDLASLVVVMLRSQGVPATYISGQYYQNGEAYWHGWIRWFDSTTNTWNGADPTSGAFYLTGDYFPVYNK